jgi:hypothetical protein
MKWAQWFSTATVSQIAFRLGEARKSDSKIVTAGINLVLAARREDWLPRSDAVSRKMYEDFYSRYVTSACRLNGRRGLPDDDRAGAAC